MPVSLVPEATFISKKNVFPGLFWVKCVWTSPFSHGCTNSTLLPHTPSSKTTASIGLRLSKIHGKYQMFCVSSEGMVMEGMFATPEYCACDFSWIRAHRVCFRPIFSYNCTRMSYFWEVGRPGNTRRIHKPALGLIPCACHSQMVAPLCLQPTILLWTQQYLVLAHKGQTSFRM